MSKPSGDFNDILVESIGTGLAMVLGVEGAKSVTFFVDPHIAVADPEIYADSVKKLLNTETETLFATILDNLCRSTGASKDSATSFGDGVADLRRKFQQP